MEHSFIDKRQVSTLNMLFIQANVLKISEAPENVGQRHLTWMIFSGTKRQLDHLRLSKATHAVAQQVTLSL